MRANGWFVFTLLMQFAHYSYQLTEVEDVTRELQINRLTPKKKPEGEVGHLQAPHPGCETT